MMSELTIRRAILDDAGGIAAIWEVITSEKRYSAVSRPFTLEEERAYIASLSDREAIGVLTRQVKIDGQYDDEVVMEMFL